jgi:hypothetical protein
MTRWIVAAAIFVVIVPPMLLALLAYDLIKTYESMTGDDS